MTDEDGAVVARQLYTPFGESRWSEGTLPTDYGFTGQRLDDIGLLFLHARWYDGVLGRFVSADTIVPNPARPQDLNRYSYARNNVLRYTDPSGHFTRDELVEWGGYTPQELDWLEQNSPEWYAILMAAQVGNLLSFGYEGANTIGSGIFSIMEDVVDEESVTRLFILGQIRERDSDAGDYALSFDGNLRTWQRAFSQFTTRDTYSGVWGLYREPGHYQWNANRVSSAAWANIALDGVGVLINLLPPTPPCLAFQGGANVTLLIAEITVAQQAGGMSPGDFGFAIVDLAEAIRPLDALGTIPGLVGAGVNAVDLITDIGAVAVEGSHYSSGKRIPLY